jgi:hypothetical protein
MLTVECESCRNRRLCPMASDHHRDTLLAWAKDAPSPECGMFAPAWHHGIEGVPAAPPRPLPRVSDSRMIIRRFA